MLLPPVSKSAASAAENGETDDGEEYQVESVPVITVL